MSNAIKLWLIQFLFKRRPPCADGRPLYAYHVSELEYQDLQQTLRSDPDGWQQPLRHTYWAACFAIYVSESYRRKYDPEAGYSWAAFETPLGVAIPVDDRRKLVRAGMDYWQRPIRQFENGNNDYLGSLFAEGGVPWSLLSSGHPFGRAVRSAVRYYEHDRESGRSPTARIAEAMPGFPQAFRNEEVCLLLAGIVSQLTTMVVRCRLLDGQEPLSVLDRDMPTWREDFPIPLDDANANQLVREWLDEAKRARESWKQRQLDRPSSCTHRLAGAAADLRSLVSIVDIQSEIRFKQPPTGLSSTRLELVCYEGHRLAQRVGVAYAEIHDDAIQVKAPKTRIELRRGHLELPLSLKLLSSGAIVHTIDIPGSVIEADSSPSIFALREDAWWYLSSFSCHTQAEKVRIRLPADWQVISGSTEAVDSDDAARWVQAAATLTIGSDQEEVCIDFSGASTLACRLVGTTCPITASPHETFLGWPRLVCEADDGEPLQPLHLVNGRARNSLTGGGNFGLVSYQLRNSSGLTLFRQRFGLLPADFRVRRIAAHAGQPAKLLVTSKEPLLLTAYVGASPGSSWSHVGKSALMLPDAAHLERSEISLAVRSSSNLNSLILRFPFPFVGVQVTNASGERVLPGTLTLEDLPGMEAVLFAGPGGATTFRVVLQLICRAGGSPQQHSSIRVSEEPVAVRLNSFAEDLAMLLGVSSDQDAQVRMSFDSNGTEHLVFRVGRYKYAAAYDEFATDVYIATIGSKVPIDGAAIGAMCIPRPGDPMIPLTQALSQGTPTGMFRVPEPLQADGPWILCAPVDAAIRFRPLFVVGNPRDEADETAGAFARAVRQFHPKERPGLIAEEVVAMQTDMNHPGWDYLRKLKDEWSHLPLSVFEAWKAVANNPRALAQAVLRLELAGDFCQRIASDLGVIWEAVPLQVWREALKTNEAWLASLGLPPYLMEQLRESSIAKFKRFLPDFQGIEDYLQGEPLRNFPLEPMMLSWHMDLCRQQAHNDHWPTQCGKELRAWALQQPLPGLLKDLPKHSFMNAVTFLPMFLGCVSAGKTPLELQGVSSHILRHAVRHVAGFDRPWFTSAHALMTTFFAQET